MQNHKHGTNETPGFKHFSNYMGPYYGLMSENDGYGGFDYSSDVFFMNRSTWTKPNGVGYVNGWCDTGYQNACHGEGEAWIYGSGMMESANLKETFSLDSMIAAASWSINQPWLICSYTYKNGKLHLKAADMVYLSSTKAETINFSRLGKPGDFRDIAAFLFHVEGEGSPGHTCTSGNAIWGYQIAFDDLKIHWNGKIPDGHGAGLGMILPPHVQHHIHATPLPIEHNGYSPQSSSIGAHSEGPSHHDPGGGYQSQLQSLDHDGSLTAQFVLPQPEHFGT